MTSRNGDLAIKDGEAQLAQAPSIEATIAKIAETGSTEQVEVLERLMALRKEMKAEQAKEDFFRDLAEFQANRGPLTRNAEARNQQGRKLYGFLNLDGIMAQIGPLLGRLGFAVTYGADESVPGLITTTCTVHHKGGHSLSASAVTEVPTTTPLPLSGSQKRGTARSYGRRYALIACLNLTDADEDNDGAAPPSQPSGPVLITDKEAIQITEGIDSVEARNDHGLEDHTFRNRMLDHLTGGKNLGVAAIPASKRDMARQFIARQLERGSK